MALLNYSVTIINMINIHWIVSLINGSSMPVLCRSGLSSEAHLDEDFLDLGHRRSMFLRGVIYRIKCAF